MDGLRTSGDDAARWMRLSHAALRLRCESPQWAREHAALQTRRDTCFSQAVSGENILVLSQSYIKINNKVYNYVCISFTLKSKQYKSKFLFFCLKAIL